MDFDNRTKNMVRRSILSLVEEPVRNAIMLPSENCNDIIELIRLDRIDDESFFHCYERDKTVRSKMENVLEHLGLNYYSYSDLTSLNLRSVLQGEKSNFINLDLCGMMTSQLFNWLYFNFKIDKENILTNNAFVSFNISVTHRGGRPFFFYKNESEPTKGLSFHIKRNLSNYEEDTIPEIFSTLSDFFYDDIFMSDQMIYQSDNAKMIMSTSTFLLGKEYE